jgi:predicted amidohydrolase YtcJ
MSDYRFAYPWNTVLKGNKMLAFGSDAFVHDASPILRINTVVKRIPENVPFERGRMHFCLRNP